MISRLIQVSSRAAQASITSTKRLSILISKTSCAEYAAAHAASENPPTANSRVDRARTIRWRRSPSPSEKHRADSLAAEVRAESYHCGSRIADCGFTAEHLHQADFGLQSVIRNCNAVLAS